MGYKCGETGGFSLSCDAPAYVEDVQVVGYEPPSKPVAERKKYERVKQPEAEDGVRLCRTCGSRMRVYTHRERREWRCSACIKRRRQERDRNNGT